MSFHTYNVICGGLVTGYLLTIVLHVVLAIVSKDVFKRFKRIEQREGISGLVVSVCLPLLNTILLWYSVRAAILSLFRPPEDDEADDGKSWHNEYSP